MTPEQLLALVQRAQGNLPPERINALITQASGEQFSTLAQLQAAATAAAQPTPATPVLERPDVGFIGGLAQAGLQGATMGFSDELIGALRGSTSQGRTTRGEIQQERDELAAFREEHPLLSGAAEIGGGLLTGTRALQFAGKGLLGLGSRLPQSSMLNTLRAARAGQFTRPLASPLWATAREAGRVALRPAAIGAAEAGAYGVGTGEGGLLDRLPRAILPGIFGGMFAGGASILANTGRIARAGRRVRQASESMTPDRIAQGLEEIFPGAPSSKILDDVAARRPEISRGFQALEAQGRTATPDLARALEQRNARRAVTRVFKNIRGEDVPEPGTALKFDDLQDVAGELQDRVNALFRQGRSNQARRVLEERRTLMGAIDEAFEGAPELRAAWRQTVEVPEAIKTGRAAVKAPVRDLPEMLGQYRAPETNMAARTGMLEKLADNARNRAGPPRLNGNELDRARVALGNSDELLSEYVELVSAENDRILASKLGDLAIKAAGFIYGGTSIVGGGAGAYFLGGR